MKAISEAETAKSAQPPPPSGREGDHRRVPENALARFWGSGVSGGRRARDFIFSACFISIKSIKYKNSCKFRLQIANANAGCADSTYYWLKSRLFYDIIRTKSNERIYKNG